MVPAVGIAPTRSDVLIMLLDLEHVHLGRPDRTLINDLSLSVKAGDRLGIVGLNGCGKSSLLRVMAAIDAPDRGEVRFARGVRVGVVDQNPRLTAGTVRGAVGDGWEASAVLDRLGMTPFVDRDVTTLSGGQARRVALARCLVDEHDVLLLDEPTNHLDLGAIEWLEDRLVKFNGGMVLVTHDRHLLDRLTTRVLEIDRGGTYLHVPSGKNRVSGYAAYLEARAIREEQAVVAEQTRKNLATRELAWLRRGAPARTAKPKARIESATALVITRAADAARSGELDLASLGTTRLGNKVASVRGVGHRYGDNWVVRNVDFDLEPGDRLGFAGDNGTGKTTLLDIIAGRLVPTEGSIDIGLTVQIGYLDQKGVELDPELRVRNAVAGPHRDPNHEDSRLMERFWFTGDTQWATIGQLSGGERHRLQLLLVLAQKPNVLLLDEPTNDLDLDTLRVLEDFLDDWPGAVLTVSHDRTFLDRVVEHLYVLDGRGLNEVRGGVAGWLAGRAAPTVFMAASAAPKPNASPKTKPATEPGGAKSRSHYTLSKLLDQAERKLAKATAQREAAAAAFALAKPSDHEALTRLAHDLAIAEACVAEAEEEWLHLAEERDG